VAYISHTVLNYMVTTDARFSDHLYQHFQNIIRKSTLISDVGEKERSQFFNGAREKIQIKKKAAEQYRP
jgi:hypothetical protein